MFSLIDRHIIVYNEGEKNDARPLFCQWLQWTSSEQREESFLLVLSSQTWTQNLHMTQKTQAREGAREGEEGVPHAGLDAPPATRINLLQPAEENDPERSLYFSGTERVKKRA